MQDLVGGLVEQFLREAERRPPVLAEALQQLRTLENAMRLKVVAALWIFGSVARGDASPDSDVDLVVEFEGSAEPSLLTLAHLQAMAESALGWSVDLGERAALTLPVQASSKRDMVRVF